MDGLIQGSEHIFCKGPYSKYISFCGSKGKLQKTSYHKFIEQNIYYNIQNNNKREFENVKSILSSWAVEKVAADRSLLTPDLTSKNLSVLSFLV